TALFTNRIAVQPPAHFGAVVAVSVVVETGLGVLVLCAKAEGIDFGRIAGRPDGVAEGVVVVAGGDFTGLAVPKSDDVAVGVARGIVDFSAGEVVDQQQTADITRAAECAALVETPPVVL